jgi:hypothetical protein
MANAPKSVCGRVDSARRCCPYGWSGHGLGILVRNNAAPLTLGHLGEKEEGQEQRQDVEEQDLHGALAGS